MDISYEFKLPLVFFGVPIPGRKNPYVVLLTGSNIAKVELELDTSNNTSLHLRGLPQYDWRLKFALRSFIDVLSSRLEEKLSVKLSYEITGIEAAPSSSLYALLSYSVAKAVVELGGYEMNTREILEACSSIDADAGTDYDFVFAARDALARGKPIVYREGEEPIALNQSIDIRLKLVGEEEASEALPGLGEPLDSIITRLAGILSIEAVKTIEAEDSSNRFKLLYRLENALYYLIYGLSPPSNDNCKWIPSLKAGFLVCMAEEGIKFSL